MQEIIKEKVSVITVYDRMKGTVLPKKVRWQGKDYVIEKLGYYHRYREGRNMIHIFSVVSKEMFFRLRLDSENLQWTLEEISDGLPN